MPLITIPERKQISSISLSHDDVNRTQVDKKIKAAWDLEPQEYTLTYIDFDGDQITADIEEDFQVARVTMFDENDDALKFLLTLKDNKKEIILKESKVDVFGYPNLGEEIKVEELKESNLENQILVNPAGQMKNQAQIQIEKQKALDIQERRIQEEMIGQQELMKKSEQTARQMKEQEEAKLKRYYQAERCQAQRCQAERYQAQRCQAEKRQQAERCQAQRCQAERYQAEKRQQAERCQVQRNAKEIAEIQMIQKEKVERRSRKKIIKKSVSPLKKTESDEKSAQEKQKEEEDKARNQIAAWELETKKKQQEEKKKKLKEDQKKKKEQAQKLAKAAKEEALKKKKEQVEAKQKAKKQILEKKKKQQQEKKAMAKVEEKEIVPESKNITEETIRNLARQEILSMIPVIREQLGMINEKTEAKVPASINIIKEDNTVCKLCGTNLKVPFYFDSVEEIYICSYCELKDTKSTNSLIKIRNPNYLTEMGVSSLVEVNLSQFPKGIDTQTPIFFEECKKLSTQKVHQKFNKKVNTLKKKIQDEAQRKKQEEMQRKKLEEAQKKKQLLQEAQKKKKQEPKKSKETTPEKIPKVEQEEKQQVC